MQESWSQSQPYQSADVKDLGKTSNQTTSLYELEIGAQRGVDKANSFFLLKQGQNFEAPASGLPCFQRIILWVALRE